MKKATKLVFDHEAFNAPQPERVTRKVLLNGKYASVSMRKLKPGEKRMDPIERLLQLREEILREQAERGAGSQAA